MQTASSTSGAGIRLPTDAAPGRIQAAVRELLTEGDSQRTLPSPHAARRIAAADPDRIAGEALEQAARRGGSQGRA